MDTPTINWLAVALAALSSFLVGGVWHNVLFVKQWQKFTGLKEADLRKGTAKVFALSFVLSLIMAANLAFFIGDNDANFGLFAGFAAGFGWVAMAFGVNYLFERKPLALFAINGGYNVVTFTLMGFILGAM